MAAYKVLKMFISEETQPDLRLAYQFQKKTGCGPDDYNYFFYAAVIISLYYQNDYFFGN